ncbi:MAG: UDP-N-acetylglucosamine 2-epimerase (non-hydrolyzing) [Acidobacteria bacterium]|nr:UDP-N-acetylglucosamine 2-epimerase (non-hydrolyzing) [Acidobacteriota bacterium]
MQVLDYLGNVVFFACACAATIGIVRFLIVAGARPNFMKVAPILNAFERIGRGSDVLLVHTGQHYDHKMSGSFFRDLGIREPDINLGIGSGTHSQQTGRTMIAFEEVCLKEKPEWVLVVGDVNSTLACTLAAKKLGIQVAHVEAGLRSGDMSMPEEINRLCTDAIADLLFTTDTLAGENLRREGVAPERIHFVGNTMIDTLLRHVAQARSLPLSEGLEEGRYAVVTLHRPANVDHPGILSDIVGAVTEVSLRIPVVFPAHPRTLGRLTEFGLRSGLEGQPGIRIVEPLGYLAFLGLMARSRMILTDSGGIQEETTVLGIPCITMRENTERPITCTIGTNVLVGRSAPAILAAASRALEFNRTAYAPPEKWDGRAAERIVAILAGNPLV